MLYTFFVELLGIASAAKELKLSKDRVRDFCREGRLGRKVDGTWIITRAELDAFKAQDRPPGRPSKE